MGIKETFLTLFDGNKELTDIIINSIPNSSRTRTLLFNLKKFPHLKKDLLDKKLDPIYFAISMTHAEMLPKSVADIKKEIKSKIEIPDGIIKCNECNSMKTELNEHHTLEHTIIHVYCTNCNSRWKI